MQHSCLQIFFCIVPLHTRLHSISALSSNVLYIYDSEVSLIHCTMDIGSMLLQARLNRGMMPHRYLAQHSAFADLVDYSEFTAVVDPADLESSNIVDLLEQRYGAEKRLKLTQRLHQVRPGFGHWPRPGLQSCCSQQNAISVLFRGFTPPGILHGSCCEQGCSGSVSHG